MALVNDGSQPEDSYRGDIWEIDLKPIVGEEKDRSRPCIVISSDALLPLKVRLVVPLTSWQRHHDSSPHLYVPIEPTVRNGLRNKSVADVLQTRCVSIERFQSKYGSVNSEIIEDIAAALASIIDFA